MAEANAQAVEEQLLDQEQTEVEEEIQEEQVEEQSNEVNHLEQAQEDVKKWQSMYDKAQADNQKMQSAMTEYLNSQKQQQQEDSIPQVSEEEFNPWEAYYKPESASYQKRLRDEKNHIHSVLDSEIQRMENKMAMNNTRNELRNDHNMSGEEVNEFLEFVSQPKESVPIQSLVKLWKESTGKAPISNVQVPQTKQPTPRTAGVLQGQPPKTKSEGEKMWKAIMNSGSRSNVLKQTK